MNRVNHYLIGLKFAPLAVEFVKLVDKYSAHPVRVLSRDGDVFFLTKLQLEKYGYEFKQNWSLHIVNRAILAQLRLKHNINMVAAIKEHYNNDGWDKDNLYTIVDMGFSGDMVTQMTNLQIANYYQLENTFLFVSGINSRINGFINYSYGKLSKIGYSPIKWHDGLASLFNLCAYTFEKFPKKRIPPVFTYNEDNDFILVDHAKPKPVLKNYNQFYCGLYKGIEIHSKQINKETNLMKSFEFFVCNNPMIGDFLQKTYK